MKLLYSTRPVCQSCGTPMQQDSQKGTEKNGNLSDLYCRHCYAFGIFTDKAMTAEKMSRRVQQKMLDLRFPPYLANRLAEHVYTLKRWSPSGN